MSKTITESMLKKYIATPPKGSIVLHFTPEIAQFVLNRLNNKNRPINDTKVMALSRDMTTDNWSLTGETIKFGTDGLLKDGQHRLKACWKANNTFTTHVIFGIDPETFRHIDTGKKRDGKDTLAMMGVANYSMAATTIRMIIAYESGLARSPAQSVSNDWIKRKYEDELDHDLLQESIEVSKRVYKTTKWPSGIIGAFFYVAVQKGQRDYVVPFFDDMCKGIGAKVRSPIPYLLENVNRMRMDRDYQLGAHQYSILLGRAYRNYKLGKTSTKADVTVTLNDKMVDF